MEKPPYKIIGANSINTRTCINRIVLIDWSDLIRQMPGIFHHLVKRAPDAAISMRAKPVRNIAAQHVKAFPLILQNLHCKNCILIGHRLSITSLNMSFHGCLLIYVMFCINQFILTLLFCIIYARVKHLSIIDIHKAFNMLILYIIFFLAHPESQD